MPDDHENDMFDRVVRQITNRIGEMEDNMQQFFSRQGGDGHPTGGQGGGVRDGGRFGGGGGRGGRGPGDGGPGNGGPGGDSRGVITMLDRQNRQMIEMKKELDEVKQLMFRLLKAPPPTPKQTEEALPYSQPPIYPVLSQSPASSAYDAPQFIPPGRNFFDEPGRQLSGYQTEPDRAQKGRRRRRGRGRKAQSAASDYDSDVASTYSEQMPMLSYNKPGRPASFSGGNAGGGKGRNRRGKGKKQTLGGSWEDIRSETEA